MSDPNPQVSDCRVCGGKGRYVNPAPRHRDDRGGMVSCVECGGTGKQSSPAPDTPQVSDEGFERAVEAVVRALDEVYADLDAPDTTDKEDAETALRAALPHLLSTQHPVQQGQEGRLREGQVAVVLSRKEAKTEALLLRMIADEFEADAEGYAVDLRFIADRFDAALQQYSEDPRTGITRVLAEQSDDPPIPGVDGDRAALQDSEERCERCGGTGEVVETIPSGQTPEPSHIAPCPNCSRDTGRGAG